MAISRQQSSASHDSGSSLVGVEGNFMRLVRMWVFVLTIPLCLNAADLKVTKITHYTRVLNTRTEGAPADQDWTRTEIIYVHGPMRRFEFHNSGMSGTGGLRNAAEIDNCETRDRTMLDLDAREYTSYKELSEEEMRSAAAQRMKNLSRDLSSLKRLSESNTVDTGETARMFGYTAHHYFTTTHTRPQGEIAIQMGMRQESTVDAWYADADINLPPRRCTPKDLETSELQTIQSSSLDERHSGPRPHGFPLKVKTVAHITTDTPAGSTEITQTTETTVTEISDASLDPNLFTAPPNFKHVACLRDQPCGGK